MRKIAPSDRGHRTGRTRTQRMQSNPCNAHRSSGPKPMDGIHRRRPSRL